MFKDLRWMNRLVHMVGQHNPGFPRIGFLIILQVME